MDPKVLMDKKDRLSYDILSVINKASNTPVNMADMADELGMSSYKLGASLNAINNDLFEITKGYDVHVNELRKDLWQAQNLSSLIIEKLKLEYIKRSPSFPAFEYVMFYSKQVSPNLYLEQTYISRAVFYRKLKSVNAFIDNTLEQEYHFKKTPETEFQQRLILFQFYYNLYNGLEVPFPELTPLVNDIITICTPYFDHKLRLSQKFKLSIFLRIWLLRCKNFNRNQTMTMDVENCSNQYQDLYDELNHLLHRAIEFDDYEMSYLYGFLLAKGYIKNSDEHEITNNFPLATSITDDFMSWIYQFKVLEELPEEVEQHLHQNLLDVNLQLTSFYIEPTTFVRESSIKFFGKTYPSFDILVNRFIRQIKDRYDLDLDSSSWTNLYYGYMFALINNISAELIKERVYVAIDFSQGDLYTTYVTNSLDAFHHANIIIENNITEKTDIFVSDVFSPSVKIPQLTWEDPPTPTDWTNLGNTIEKIRADKAFNLFNEQLQS